MRQGEWHWWFGEKSLKQMPRLSKGQRIPCPLGFPKHPSLASLSHSPVTAYTPTVCCSHLAYLAFLCSTPSWWLSNYCLKAFCRLMCDSGTRQTTFWFASCLLLGPDKEERREGWRRKKGNAPSFVLAVPLSVTSAMTLHPPWAEAVGASGK